MDKSFLDITGCKSSFEPILRQKNSRGFGESRKKRRSFRKPAFEFAVSKGSGKQYCMQFIPLAVLKLVDIEPQPADVTLHAIHTACGIETC